MTDGSEPGGRAALRDEAGRTTALTRLAIGLAQGLALYALFRLTPGSSPWSELHPAAFAMMVLPALFLPPVLLASVGRLRVLTLVVWGGIVAAVLALLAWHDVARQSGEAAQPTPQLFLFSAVALFIAHHLLVPADQARRPLAPYPAYFDTAWMAGVQLAASVAFTGAFWLLLALGAALFNVIGLPFFGDLLVEPWLFLPVTGLVFATAVHLTDVREGLIRGVRTIALMLLSWLLLVLTVLVGAFLLALPFTGLEVLWRTGSATALLLATAGGLIILINAAYQDGRDDNLPPHALRLAVRAASVLLVPLMAIAVWGLALRIGQHGLTPDRIIAAACAAVGALHAGGYAYAALASLRAGTDWMRPLERTNIVGALLGVVLIVALFTPLADPARLSVTDQVARLQRGAVAPEEFDFAFLRFESGRVGQAALARLVRSEDAAVAALARRASEAENRYDDDTVLEPLNRPVVQAWPADRPLPQGFAAPFRGSGVLAECRDREDCLASVQDLNADGVPDVLLASETGLWLFTRDAEGAWREEGAYPILRCPGEDQAPDARALMRSGALRPRSAAWPDMDTGGRAASRLTAGDPCASDAVAGLPVPTDP